MGHYLWLIEEFFRMVWFKKIFSRFIYGVDKNKINPSDDKFFYSIGSVHTIRDLKDLKLDFIDNTPDKYNIKVVDSLIDGEVIV